MPGRRSFIILAAYVKVALYRAILNVGENGIGWGRWEGGGANVKIMTGGVMFEKRGGFKS